jgi:hypothetical protein
MKNIEVFGSPYLLIIRDAGLNIQKEVTLYHVIQVSGWINCLCSGGTSEQGPETLKLQQMSFENGLKMPIL